MAPVKRSLVWNFYTKDLNTITCKECKVGVKAQAGNTSNLKRHLEKHHPTLYQKMKELEAEAKPTSSCPALNTKQTKVSDFTTPGPKDVLAKDHPLTKRLDFAIAKMICVDFQPLSVVEDQGFRGLIESVCPRYQIPSRKTYAESIIPKMYKEKKVAVLKLFETECPSSLAVTSDAWTSRNNQSYLSLTAHFVSKDMNLVSVCLAVKPFQEHHTAKNISECLETILKEIGVPLTNMTLYIITDNAKNMTNAAEAITDDNSGDSLTCCAHTLQLVIKHSLGQFRGLEKILSKLRTITGMFKHSPIATAALTKAQTQLQLPAHKLKQDVSTRFNSTFYMLERSVEQKRAITLVLAEETKVQNLTPYEWKTADKLLEILRPIEAVTEMLCGEQYSTASMIIPAISQLKEILLSKVNPGEDLNDLATALLNNIDLYWPDLKSHPILRIATFIDPRFKLVAFDHDERQTIFNQVKELCVSWDPSQSLNNTHLNTTAESVGEGTSEPFRKKETQKLWDSFSEKVTAEYSEGHHGVGVDQEIDSYMKMNPIPVSKTNNPLWWWKEKETCFPQLTKLARQFLAIPATSVSSERLFSKAGIVVSNRRCSLKSSLVEQLVFLNINWNIT